MSESSFVLLIIAGALGAGLGLGFVVGEGSVRTEAVTNGFGYWDANKEFHWRDEK